MLFFDYVYSNCLSLNGISLRNWMDGRRHVTARYPYSWQQTNLCWTIHWVRAIHLYNILLLYLFSDYIYLGNRFFWTSPGLFFFFLRLFCTYFSFDFQTNKKLYRRRLLRRSFYSRFCHFRSMVWYSAFRYRMPLLLYGVWKQSPLLLQLFNLAC